MLQFQDHIGRLHKCLKWCAPEMPFILHDVVFVEHHSFVLFASPLIFIPRVNPDPPDTMTQPQFCAIRENNHGNCKALFSQKAQDWFVGLAFKGWPNSRPMQQTS